MVPLRYHHKKDGTVFPVEITGRFFVWRGRSVHIAAIRDITARKRIEEALRESEEKFRTFTESAPVAIMIYQGYRCVYANPEAEQIIGYTHKELEQMKFWDFVHPDYKDMIIEAGKALERGESPLYKADFKIIAKNGDEKWLDGRLEMIDYEGKRAALISAMDITAHKWAEEALRESEERYRRITQAVTDYIYTVRVENGQAIETRHGAGCVAVTGYTSQEFEADPYLWYRMVTEEDRPAVQDQARRVLAGEDVPPLEHRIICKDGVERWVRNTPVPHRNAEGKLLAYDGLIQDITERKQAEQELKESEEKFGSLAEQSPNMVFINKRGKIMYANKRCEEIMGHTREEFYSADFDFRAITAPEYVDLVETKYAQHMRGEEVEPYEYALIAKDGKRIEAISATRLIDYGGESAILGIITDITARKRAEEEVKKLNQDLERRARELAALNQAGQIMASTLDLEVLLGLVMERVRSLLDTEAASVLLRVLALEGSGDELIFAAASGPHSEGLMGTRLPITAGVAGWVVQERQPALVADAQSDPRFYNRIDAATRMTTRSLLAVPLLFQDTAQGVLEAVNKISGAFDEHDLEMLEALAGSAAIAIENARLVQAERDAFRRLQESQAQLVQAEKMAALGRLVASIAHEINNPLQAMQNSLELAGEELEGSLRRDKLARYLNMARSEVERLAAIVRRMRDFYRPAREGLRSTDVNAVLQNVLELAGKQLQHSHVTVERDWTADLPTIQANPDYLKQVFLNLVLNAIDAMAAQGGGMLRLRTALDQMQTPDHRSLPTMRIEFEDTGQGIPPEILPHIFEPFTTTKTTGTGLGLSISYRLIEAHNGQITVTSQVGVGTNFVILLPIGET
jgi:two-component system NtrC family sensor kinase